jgi:D-alanine-D-alanine ligase
MSLQAIEKGFLIKTGQQVAVLKGGFSAEREVSLQSGAAVAAGLREAGYDVIEIDVSSPDFSVPEGVAAVFIVLHGTFGEDGGAQARLEELGIPYVGTGVEASRVAFDKLLTEIVLREAGVPVPESETLRAGQAHTLSLPLVVKPPRQGSSVGCHLVFDEAEWDAAFADALQYDSEVLVQQYIPGREFTVGVVESPSYEASAIKWEVLPVVEIVTGDGWYDYTAKYEVDTTRYVVPAELDELTVAELQAMALRTFEALGALGFGRVDFRMNPAGELFVLELNTIPGFTSHSLLPKAAAAAGIDFPSLCDRIMRTALL